MIVFKRKSLIKIISLMSFFILASVYTSSAADSFRLTVTTDQSAYSIGDTIIVNAQALYEGNRPVTNIKKTLILINDATGRAINRDSLISLGDGNFSYSYVIPPGINAGAWEIQTTVQDMSRDTAVVSSYIAVNGDGAPPVTNNIVADLSVTPASSSYARGQMITVTSQASYSNGTPIMDLKKSLVEVMDATGFRLIRDNMDRVDGTTFTYGFAIPANGQAGSWTIKVTIEDSSRVQEQPTTSIAVVDDVTPPSDNDGDGYTIAAGDCNDNNPAVNPGVAEVCDDNIDNNCNGQIDEGCYTCQDADGDGFTDAACGGNDCNDNDPDSYPGATEICGDGIDQDCNGSDLTCSGEPHANLLYKDYPGNCLSCHKTEFNEMYQSVHYQWQGSAPDMVNQPNVKQGKINNSVNSYCINIKGDWPVCGGCHVGRGTMPVPATSPTDAQLANIDCLVCHQSAYKRVKDASGVFVADAANMTISPDEAVRTVHLPIRVNCLQCHANAGGGDAVKRGDLAMATVNTTDSHYDVHMANTGADLNCQACHAFMNHKVTGKGSDLRPTDLASEVKCTKCHTGKDSTTGHSTSAVNNHVGRVACQTCHIPRYAKNANDTVASEATETHRSWLDTSHHTGTPPFHPGMIKQNNLIPEYRFWNRKSDNYLLGDVAKWDATNGAYPTSRPVGDINDPASKLYPFKYKTAEQPIRNANNMLIALDTYEYIKVSGDPDKATQAGLVNMGYSAGDSYSWILTDTYQLLNHQVPPASEVLTCSSCHNNTAQMNLKGELGYNLKGSTSSVCSQCHSYKSYNGDYLGVHSRHVTSRRYDCSWCHNFSRPERGLR